MKKKVQKVLSIQAYSTHKDILYFLKIFDLGNKKLWQKQDFFVP